ncbi:MAG: methyltransferase domain-containing protein [Actinomycetota bacterium]
MPAQRIAAGGEDPFPSASFASLAEIEPHSFWFRGRNRLIVWALDRYFPEASSLLEVGCGTGFVLAGIHDARPAIRLAGGEIYDEALEIAARRAPKAKLVALDGRSLPFPEAEFELVCAFDVLEHVDEDEALLGEMRRVATTGGGLLATVPQHPRLWSAFDEVAMHRRRYRRSDLASKLRHAGFEPTRVTSFMSLPLPLLALGRLRNRHPRAGWDPLAALHPSKPVNFALERLLDVERALISSGVSFRAGGSLLVAARATRAR